MELIEFRKVETPTSETTIVWNEDAGDYLDAPIFTSVTQHRTRVVRPTLLSVDGAVITPATLTDIWTDWKDMP